MRSMILLPILGICLLVSNASAGRVFGDIKVDGKPVPAGLPVEVLLAASTAQAAGDTVKPAMVRADSTSTDKYGSYKLTVKPQGKCTLRLVYEKQALTLEVFSYKDPTRYDLVIEKKDGTLSLRRK
jgi:hypothetical protein